MNTSRGYRSGDVHCGNVHRSLYDALQQLDKAGKEADRDTEEACEASNWEEMRETLDDV